jgi:hypothetical protein
VSVKQRAKDSYLKWQREKSNQIVVPIAAKNTIMEPVVWQGTSVTGFELTESCIVMTRRIRWLAMRSRTTVFPKEDCDFVPGFIIWWNTNDRDALALIHHGMVQVIKRVGFSEPATWCKMRFKQRSPDSLPGYWREQLGELFRYYRKAT